MSAHTNKTLILEEAAKTCTTPWIYDFSKPLSIGWRFHFLINVVASTCLGLTLLVTVIGVSRHLTHYTVPSEQRQVVRILLTPLVFVLFNCLSLWVYSASPYLELLASLYEAFALVAIFLLFLATVCPDADNYDSFFAKLDRTDRSQKKLRHSHGSLRWFYVVWVMVFQILPTRLLNSVATWVINAVMCSTDPSKTTAKTIVEVVQGLFTVLCLIYILQFYGRLRPVLKGRGAVLKLAMFKLMVFIQLVQTPIFNGLMAEGIIKPREYISMLDFEIGIPAVLTCIEMLIFSLLFLLPFSAKPYMHGNQDLENRNAPRQPQQMGAFAALLDATNITDVVKGAFTGNKLLKIFSKKTTWRENHPDQLEFKPVIGRQPLSRTPSPNRWIPHFVRFAAHE